MDDDTRGAYEHECVAELERWIQGNEQNPSRFQRVREVRLVGAYPKTAIYVRWVDTRTNEERDRTFHLWINPVTHSGPGSFEHEGPETVGREPPSEVAMLIHTWIGET